jgi:hypothetical protein
MTRILSYLGRFLELRLRAFVYALLLTVGFVLGVVYTTLMAMAMLRAVS